MQDEIPYAASQRLTDLVPVISLIPNPAAADGKPFSTTSAPAKSLLAPHSGAAAGDHLCYRRTHGACWSCPPWLPNHAGIRPLLLRLDAVGWALRSVSSSISTSGSAASDADNSEKISSKTPLSHQRRKRLWRVLWGPSAAGAPTQPSVVSRKEMIQ